MEMFLAIAGGGVVPVTIDSVPGILLRQQATLRAANKRTRHGYPALHGQLLPTARYAVQINVSRQALPSEFANAAAMTRLNDAIAALLASTTQLPA